MKDAQTVFLRLSAKIDNVDFITTIFERNYLDATKVTAVKINGKDVGYGLVNSATLTYALPPGVSPEEVQSIVYEQSTTSTDGVTEILQDSRPIPDPGTIGTSAFLLEGFNICLLYTSPSPRDRG